MQTPRVDVRRLLRVLLLAGVFPLTALILTDLAVGLWPILTIFGTAVVLPLGSFLVSRAALDEFNKVIEEVAPLEDEAAESDASAD